MTTIIEIKSAIYRSGGDVDFAERIIRTALQQLKKIDEFKKVNRKGRDLDFDLVQVESIMKYLLHNLEPGSKTGMYKKMVEKNITEETILAAWDVLRGYKN